MLTAIGQQQNSTSVLYDANDVLSSPQSGSHHISSDLFYCILAAANECSGDDLLQNFDCPTTAPYTTLTVYTDDQFSALNTAAATSAQNTLSGDHDPTALKGSLAIR
eukprot:2931-Heterococcus_DN1.PRE.12